MFGIFSTAWGLLTGRSSTKSGSSGKQSKAATAGVGEVVIFVIGPTGAGKSTLINAIRGNNDAVVGHSLSTCTETFAHFEWTLPSDAPVHPGKRVLLVDTPGFDDTAMNDSTRVFKGIPQWVTDYMRAHPESPKPHVVGFVYLQDITQKRINNRQNVDFQRLLQLAEGGPDGDKASSPFSNLVLATYQWPVNKEGVGYEQAEERIQELEGKFWKDLIGMGARMVRVEDPVHDPRKVVYEVLNGRQVEFPA